MPLNRPMLIAIAMASLVSCDKAKEDYERCIKLEQTNDPEGALQACRQAAKLDPNSKSGQAAAAKAEQLLPTVLKLSMDKAAAETAARLTKSMTPEKQAEIDKAKQALRAKIHRSRTYAEADDHCAGEGKPSHSYRYGGGTYSENESIAYSDGCVPYDKDSVAVAGNAQNHFCCP